MKVFGFIFFLFCVPDSLGLSLFDAARQRVPLPLVPAKKSWSAHNSGRLGRSWDAGSRSKDQSSPSWTRPSWAVRDSAWQRARPGKPARPLAHLDLDHDHRCDGAAGRSRSRHPAPLEHGRATFGAKQTTSASWASQANVASAQDRAWRRRADASEPLKIFSRSKVKAAGSARALRKPTQQLDVSRAL